MSTPASVQPANSWWVFPCWYKVRTLYVETIRGLKAGRRQFSRPSVRVGVPSSRWPVIESSFDSRPATFDFVLVFFLVIFVTELVPCNSSNPVWQAVPRGWSALGASGEWFVGFSFPLVPMDLTIHTTLLYDWEREKDKGIVTAPVGTHTSICPTKENEGCCPLSCQADAARLWTTPPNCGQHPHSLMPMWGYAFTLHSGDLCPVPQCDVANGLYGLPRIQAPLTYIQDRSIIPDKPDVQPPSQLTWLTYPSQLGCEKKYISKRKW